MYESPRISDFGRIELHTYQAPGSADDESPDETPTAAVGGGAGAGVGLIGLIGGALVLAGRSNEDQTTAVVPPGEEEKAATRK
jgi:hypothetical protein